MIGKIKFFNRTRGFGFICSEGVDYFFHHTNFKGVDDQPSVLDALVYFQVSEPLAVGKRVQATKIRFATTQDAPVVGGLESVQAGV